MNHDAVSILALGTATPPRVPQTQITPIAETLCCRTPQHRALLQRLFSRSGVDFRGSVLAADYPTFYPPRREETDLGPTTADRMLRYTQEAPPLAASACREALEQSGLAPARITHLITVSCTGFFAPGPDVRLIKELGLSPQVQRLHIGFMGCHAAFNALAAARDIVRANPAAVVLICCVELSSLHMPYEWDPESLVASALFADGAAAAIVVHPQTSLATRWSLRATASCLLPDSTGAMTWRIGNHGFRMTLSAQVPELIHTHLARWCTAFLAAHQLTLKEIQHFAIHPGGPRILTAVAEALGLPATALLPARHILANYGNMSSATILFLLEHLAQDHPPGRTLALGFGPGLMAEAMLLERP